MPSPPQNKAQLEKRDPQRWAQLEGRGFSQGSWREQGLRAGRKRSDMARDSTYHGVLGLGEVNEIRLLPPTLLLPLIEAIRQDHAALALEQSTLEERKHE